MRSIVIAGTQLRVSRWSFGTGSLHRIFSSRARRRLLDRAADIGFSHFDTSPYYGYGLAETDLGRFMRGRRASVTVATKVGLYPRSGTATGATALWMRKGWERLSGRSPGPRADWRVRAAQQSLDASLRRLGTDHVDFLFLHEPDPACIDAGEFLLWLRREKERGRVRAWGLAGVDVAALQWVRDKHELASVLQLRDSVERCEADRLSEQGRALQFTYGYFAGQSVERTPDSPRDFLGRVLMRNPDGSVIVATRREDRLPAFAEIAGT